MTWKVATADAIGGRAEQQDRVGAWQDTGNDAVLAVVADGVGGHRGGAQAAQIVLDTASEFWSRSPRPVAWPHDLLTEICLAAHERINAAGDGSDSDPASTCAILYADDKLAAWAHVGDSRIYHFREGKPVGRTKDHSVVQLLLDQGEIAESEMASHPDQNLILQSLGGDRAPKVSFDQVSIQPGDGFVLCSDGLWEMMQAGEMGAALSQQDLPAAALALAGEAARRGGARGDNVSIAMVSRVGRGVRRRRIPTAFRAAADVVRRFSALVAKPAGFGRSLRF